MEKSAKGRSGDATARGPGEEGLRIVAKGTGDGSDFLCQPVVAKRRDERPESPRHRAVAQPLLSDEGRARPNFNSSHRDARH